MTGRHERAIDVVQRYGVDALLAADPGTVAWLTGFEADIETGPSPFSLGPFAVLGADGDLCLLVSEDDDPTVACQVVCVPGLTLGPLDAIANARRVLEPLIDGRRLAIEAGCVPAALVADVAWVDATEDVRAARAVKDPDEIERLRAAIALCDAGQAALRTALAPGRTELELWTAVRAAIEQAAGRRVGADRMQKQEPGSV